jgi:hypothetical protein
MGAVEAEAPEGEPWPSEDAEVEAAFAELDALAEEPVESLPGPEIPATSEPQPVTDEALEISELAPSIEDEPEPSAEEQASTLEDHVVPESEEPESEISAGPEPPEPWDARAPSESPEEAAVPLPWETAPEPEPVDVGPQEPVAEPEAVDLGPQREEMVEPEPFDVGPQEPVAEPEPLDLGPQPAERLEPEPVDVGPQPVAPSESETVEEYLSRLLNFSFESGGPGPTDAPEQERSADEGTTGDAQSSQVDEEDLDDFQDWLKSLRT